MTQPIQQDLFAFLDRCIKDIGSGTIYLSKQDRERYRKAFALVGRDVRRGFGCQNDLLGTYLRSLPPKRFFIVYEVARVLNPKLADPLDDFERWPAIEREDYLAVRILTKLNVLRADLNHLESWIQDHIGAHYLSVEGGLDFDDEERILELDRMLALRVAEKFKQDETGHSDSRGE